MGWFRQRCRLGRWVTLIALALQLALLFGHVHGEAFGHASEIAAVTVDGPDGTQPDSPAAPHDPDYCAVCAVLSLLAGAQTADAPTLPVLAVPAVTPSAEPRTFHAIHSRAAFQPRAPPLS